MKTRFILIEILYTLIKNFFLSFCLKLCGFRSCFSANCTNGSMSLMGKRKNREMLHSWGDEMNVQLRKHSTIFQHYMNSDQLSEPRQRSMYLFCIIQDHRKITTLLKISNNTYSSLAHQIQ